MTMKSSAADGESSYLHFDDNALLPELFGEHDQNLARIEQMLDVSVGSRGNRMVVSGRRGRWPRPRPPWPRFTGGWRAG